MAGEASPPRSPASRILRWLVAGTFVVLFVLLLVIFVHAAAPVDSLVQLAQLLTVALVLLSGASIVAGVAHSWRAFPQHRRAITFVVVITLLTLLAHAYIIGSPAASAGSSLSGAPGASFSDSHVTVNSNVAGSAITISVEASSKDAVADINITGDGAPLPGSGFISPPSLSNPLQPGGTAIGTWALPSRGSITNLTVSYQYLTCYSTDSKTYGCIMDEVFYVPEAMGILAAQQCSPQGPECHMEHPYLVPAMMAAGMAVFGEYNVVGWRVMPALLGSFSIPLLFGIAWKVSGDKKVAYLSATLLALDVMFFSQSSAGILDIPQVFFCLAAAFAYFAELKLWRFDKFVIVGVLLGVAGLAKETAVFFALMLMTYIVFFGEGTRRRRVYSVLKVALVLSLVFLGGLQAYDSTLASQAVPTAVQHISYMLSYGSSLRADQLACQPTTGYWCKFANDPGGAPILPTDWLVYYSPIEYYGTTVSVCPTEVGGVCQGGQYSYVALAYYGVTNFLETWTVFVWLPLMVYVLYAWYRRRGSSLDQFGFVGESPGMPRELKFAGLTLVWFIWTYLPYLVIFFTGRVTYPFYVIPAIPAMAMGAAWWVTREWFPRRLMWLYMAMVFVFFLVYFPDKGFLPDWLRVLIGH